MLQGWTSVRSWWYRPYQQWSASSQLSHLYYESGQSLCAHSMYHHSMACTNLLWIRAGRSAQNELKCTDSNVKISQFLTHCPTPSAAIARSDAKNFTQKRLSCLLHCVSKSDTDIEHYTSMHINWFCVLHQCRLVETQCYLRASAVTFHYKDCNQSTLSTCSLRPFTSVNWPIQIII